MLKISGIEISCEMRLILLAVVSVPCGEVGSSLVSSIMFSS